MLVVRTDAGRERRRAARTVRGSSGCGNGCAGDPGRPELKKSGRGADFAEPIHCGAERIRAGLHGGTGGERDHFIMALR